MGEAPDFKISKEMGVDHKDFFRFLHKIVEEGGYEKEPNRVSIPGKNGGRVEIHYSEEMERVLSPLVKMPYTNLELKFFGYSEQEHEAFMAEFRLAFHRGGG